VKGFAPYAGEMAVFSEDGAIRVGKSLEPNHRDEWYMEAVVNEEGGYVSCTITEAQLRALVAYIDLNKRAAA
jgi:hypothetical protein